MTASNIDYVVNRTVKGLPTSKYENYKIKLITERLIGQINPSYETQAMQWGVEHEDEAIEEYSFIYDPHVTRCGFISHPTFKMAGASPDGLIGKDGLIEIKCPQSTTHLRFFLNGDIKPELSLTNAVPNGLYRKKMVRFCKLRSTVYRPVSHITDESSTYEPR
ncbi:hypothetical protein H704_00967 [Bartonella bacilliformis Peru38]|uniref:Phage-related exonuclease n=1 Tax=Bartonella bacilliformis INS TaxID=1206782 RepID=A0ABP2SM80_BARBA|nr:phage-related exonuclease [Bartonella bacilliformis INS]EYS89576.1 hypothetical protein X472_00006 [Bartonella bacilliformis San Pedro600-02]KEG17116.1 hypothetical protein H705_01010 [Bartonella bacilliformis Cond044]KEG20317.1 hypothetical protein H704_00967 [Bartonella bacilliformis Peru38]KEG23100.1 hypothetical protein H703_00955 [Bartonella bacilliformis Ver075]